MVTESNYNELNFDRIRIGLASPDTILEWSQGEVKKPETINYRTLKPEKEGLFCERIFGPVKDWECHCGKYKRARFKGKTCEKCGVKITRAKVRRERIGHIKLACPVSHIWFFKGIPSRIGLMLDISPRNLEKVLYFSSYIVIDPGLAADEISKKDIINDKKYAELVADYGEGAFKAAMGAEAIRELLAEIDVNAMCEQLRAEFEKSTGQNKAKLLKRLEVAEAFKNSGNRPEWMILTVIPVIPPDLRPMVQLEGGRFATSDLNDLYRRVINRNNRLNNLLTLGAPEIIVRNEKRMLQEAVDALIDNGRKGRPVTGPSNRPLKSLSEMLKGKQGRFRQNLLGKRVDYSGRSVIVVGPELKISQCGLPKEMALELFKPFVMKYLFQHEFARNIKSAKKMVERTEPVVWDALEAVIADHPVMLNRAPTLHRLGIQAFEPVLVEGRAIKLHPLCCTAFNADFDGDQMAVHLPLSAEAQAEARFLMLAANNLLKPADGKPVTVPTQDMVLGSYYLTMVKEDDLGAGKVFSSEDEAVMAYEAGYITLHSPIKVRFSKEIDGKVRSRLVETTMGKVIFNRPVPQDLGFVYRPNVFDPSAPDYKKYEDLTEDELDDLFALEVDFVGKSGKPEPCGKKGLSRIIDRCITVHGTAEAAVMLDEIKAQGYKYSTFSGITFSVFDATIPSSKAPMIAEAEKQVDSITRSYRRGQIKDEDRSRFVIKTWEDCANAIADDTMKQLGPFNPINMMVDSG
ncbi:MAG: DNA-directed RNA polymerase subunit beta', partial [Clostridiales bacterium]|nr:DNA-directed RNA polymerase subunit beta' [Clostridiales bacterium]